MPTLFYDFEITKRFPELIEEYKKSDKWIALFVILSWVVLFGSTLILNPVHTFSVVTAAVLTLLCLLMFKLYTGFEPFRLVSAVVIALFSIIYIHINAGHLVSHAYLFIGLSVFVFYKDSKPLIAATAIIVLHHIFAYKLQGTGVVFFGNPVILFQDDYSMTTLLTYLFFIFIEGGILDLVIRQSRRNFFKFIDADDEIFEKYKELKIYDSVYENTDNGIIITTPEGTILSVNKAFEKLTGYPESFCIGKNPRFFKSDKHSEAFFRTMWSTLEAKHRWEGEIWNKNKEHENVPFWLNIDAIMEDGLVYHYIGIYTDRSQQIQAKEKMNFMASHDVLTHLINRESFMQHLRQVLYWAKVNNNQAAILSVDLNRFKTVNDTLGHDTGDRVLVEVAKNIRGVLKERDIVARPGGDEFLILLENIHSENEAASVASHIMQAVQRPLNIEGNTIHTSASVGISLFPSDGEDEMMLMKAADSAMYQAKSSGKNNFEFFKNKLSKQVMRRMKLENALHKAIEHNELYLVFQPQHLFTTGQLVSAEVLVRWNSKEYGQMSPDEFIPIAEESGLIVQIGEWVFRNSCKAIRSYKAIYPDLEYLAVNVSSAQFTSYDIVEKFSKIIKEEQISTLDIEIELTERSVMEQTGSNDGVLDTLRALGFKISVDDFGTGYSSMSYLKSLPIDAVKIDKSFVDGLPHDEGDVAIVKAILALIQSLGYHTVAEGVEYIEQVEMLKELGCEIAQGYYFSKPLNHEEFIDYIEKVMNHQ